MDEAWERLSATDAAFLEIETEAAHMHVGGVVTLSVDPVRGEAGGVDFDRVRDTLERRLATLPRLRQRLRRVPGVRHWAWVDDPHFNLGYHVRHTALPRPGDDGQLERLTSRIFSQRLDRERPLWEMWIVEGLSDDRWALIAKVHHCLLDGVGAVNLLAALVADLKHAPPAEAAKPPTDAQLVVGELKHRMAGWRAVTEAARDLWRSARAGGESSDDGETPVRDLARGVVETLKTGLQPAEATPINPSVMSPHRRYVMRSTSLDDVKRVKQLLGGTVNDVVLATVTGALRTYLGRRGVDVDALERFRALVPMSMRTPPAGGGPGLGNQVSLLLVPLPIHRAGVLGRFAAIHAHTRWLKEDSNEAAGAEWMERLDDQLGLGLVTSTLRLAMSLRSFNVVVTNVPGPPFPIELLDAPVQSIHALVPHFHQQGLGVAIFSYAGTLYWGLSADWDAVPDIEQFADDLDNAFAALRMAAMTAGDEAPAASR